MIIYVVAAADVFIKLTDIGVIREAFGFFYLKLTIAPAKGTGGEALKPTTAG